MRPATRVPAALAVLLLVAVSGCQKSSDAPTAAVDDPKSVALTADYDAAIAREDYVVAELLGGLIQQRWPASAGARHVRSGFAVVLEQADRQRERKRLADLWTWHAVPHAGGNGTVHTGFIWAQEPADPRDPMFRLVLRNHPEWGTSAYLLYDGSRPGTPGLPAPPGPVAGVESPWQCAIPACEIHIRFDDGLAQTYSAYEPDEAGTGALFIVEYDRLAAALEHARWMQIEPGLVAADPARALRFEVGGFDRPRLADNAPARLP